MLLEANSEVSPEVVVFVISVLHQAPFRLCQIYGITVRRYILMRVFACGVADSNCRGYLSKVPMGLFVMDIGRGSHGRLENTNEHLWGKCSDRD